MAEKLYLHEVIIKKTVEFPEAQRMASDIMKKKAKVFRVKEDTYRFRAIPKTYFKSDSFRSKVVNENITLVFGHLKGDKIEP